MLLMESSSIFSEIFRAFFYVLQSGFTTPWMIFGIMLAIYCMLIPAITHRPNLRGIGTGFITKAISILSAFIIIPLTGVICGGILDPLGSLASFAIAGFAFGELEYQIIRWLAPGNISRKTFYLLSGFNIVQLFVATVAVLILGMH